MPNHLLHLLEQHSIHLPQMLFFGSRSGVVSCADDVGNCVDVS